MTGKDRLSQNGFRRIYSAANEIIRTIIGIWRIPLLAMLRRFITLAGALPIFTLTPARAQQYQLRHYGVSDGLAHGSVHSIYQDRKGYIWFSTREGLSKFDGYTFANFGERNGLGRQFI